MAEPFWDRLEAAEGLTEQDKALIALAFASIDPRKVVRVCAKAIALPLAASLCERYVREGRLRG